MHKHISNWVKSARPLMVSLAAAALFAACVNQPGTHPPVATATPESSLAERVDRIHTNSLVLDAHADIVIPSTNSSYLAADRESKVSPAKLAAGGVGAVVMSLAVGPGPRTPEGDAAARAEVDEKLAAVKALIAQNSETMTLARSVEDITTAQQEGKVATLLSLQNARSIEGRLDTLDELYDAGVRIFALNHIGHNDFSDSSRPFYDGKTATYEPEQEHGGLSALGGAAIRRITELRAIVDVSQMSKAATLGAIALSKTPVIASHSNARALTDVTRNLSDEEIDRIGETGGVIHVAAFGAYLVDISAPETLEAIKMIRVKHALPEAYSYPYELYWELDTRKAQLAFLTEMRSTIGPGSIADMIRHIDYIKDRIGIDHVGIGNDFNHGSGISGYSDAADTQALTRALLEHNYSVQDIQKIWGGNFLRVLAAAEEAN